jgi:hypothetical protein
VTVSPISTIASGPPRFEGGNDISRVLGVIAAQSLELGAEPVRDQGIQELLDERIVRESPIGCPLDTSLSDHLL